MRNALEIVDWVIMPMDGDEAEQKQALSELGETLASWWGKKPHPQTFPERTPGIALANWLMADSVERRTVALHTLLQTQDGIFITWGALFDLAHNGLRLDIQERLLELLTHIACGYEPEGCPFAIRAMRTDTLLQHLPSWHEVMEFDDNMASSDWPLFDSWRVWMKTVWNSTPQQYREAVAKRTA